MSACGCDSPGDHLMAYDAALQQLLQAAEVIGQSETIALPQALGRVLAEAVVSAINVPPADNSAMDGYAVRSADTRSETEISLPVMQRICAGQTGEPLQAGTAARIFTGAPIPQGADAVIMQEHVHCDGDNILFKGPLAAGSNIRPAGEDIAAGDEILASGCRLRAQELGLAASVGCAELKVVRKLRVGLFFTGDELIEPGQPLQAGQIYDSNRYTLLGLLQTLGCEIVDLGVVGDSLQQTREAIQQASEQADLVVTSGGVSVGEEDHVRIALQEMGQLNLWRIAIKPGKPLAFAEVNATPFMGLPGNPVSAFVTFCLFVSPFIKRMQGRQQVVAQSIPLTSAFVWPRAGKRREFVRVRLVPDKVGTASVELYPHQGSGVLTSTSWADGLVMIGEGSTVQIGDTVDYFPFTELLA
ncbi:MAG: molybdopterin molybdotransferase MoeA [gamma proteobacterium symbiont of Bathyaustriella thionipta]|nr:molybdopterin molybdotransferase MoeA [gamma proteobacterium symbiont of Bathyaustriella thionipta]